MSKLREKIKSYQDIKEELVEIPAWDCSILMKSMTAKQRSSILNEVMDEEGKIQHEKLHAQMIIACCYDPETGERIFSPEDDQWLMDKSCGPVELLVGKAMQISGLAKGALEQAEKNS